MDSLQDLQNPNLQCRLGCRLGTAQLAGYMLRVLAGLAEREGYQEAGEVVVSRGGQR